ncbi:LOW QUALITY PROTEIN: Fanconi anemia group B protein [Acanthochromis polyacanthus]|uniref:LOW QUALITY PROTEIN: Fanconi anemia group B protein n=1 Tax=Acanthochromis polyacanthus TaxID=80966 RepID=UPI0022344472|nr:LOW QUALITY PROTEIN: Fanconi anemia group B protein [Acanthochromis polyacanthus]
MCHRCSEETHTACVLVTKKDEKPQSFQYSLITLSSSNRLSPGIEFKLSYQMKENVYILQGPTVLWTHEDSVFYTSLQAGGVKQIPFSFPHVVAAEFPLHKGQIFVLGLQNVSEESLVNQSTSQTVGYFVQDGLAFDGSLILPHPYICITQCIFVLKADRVDGALKCTLVAATSKQQLVYFENGAVKETCQLPFEQPENIQVVDTGRNGCLFVISFHQGHVCAVWKETFQPPSGQESAQSIRMTSWDVERSRCC